MRKPSTAIIKGELELKYLQNKRKTLAYFMHGWRFSLAINCGLLHMCWRNVCRRSTGCKNFQRCSLWEQSFCLFPPKSHQTYFCEGNDEIFIVILVKRENFAIMQFLKRRHERNSHSCWQLVENSNFLTWLSPRLAIFFKDKTDTIFNF